MEKKLALSPTKAEALACKRIDKLLPIKRYSEDYDWWDYLLPLATYRRSLEPVDLVRQVFFTIFLKKSLMISLGLVQLWFILLNGSADVSFRHTG
jgi:hypothetical protein